MVIGTNAKGTGLLLTGVDYRGIIVFFGMAKLGF